MSDAPPLLGTFYDPPLIDLTKEGPRKWRLWLKTSEISQYGPQWTGWVIRGFTPDHAYKRAVAKGYKEQAKYVKRHAPKETLEIS